MAEMAVCAPEPRLATSPRPQRQFSVPLAVIAFTAEFAEKHRRERGEATLEARNLGILTKLKLAPPNFGHL